MRAATRDVADAQRQADEIAREQKQIAEGVKGLEGTAAENRVDRIQQLSERKETLESKARRSRSSSIRAPRDMRRTDPDARASSRKRRGRCATTGCATRSATRGR